MLGWAGVDHVLYTRSPSAAISREIPNQNLAFITSSYSYLLNTGDVATMKLFYPAALAYLKLWNLQTNGLIESQPNTTSTNKTIWDWIDWGEGYDKDLLCNDWYYFAADSLIKIGTLIGDDSGTTFLNERKTSIKNAFDNAFKKNEGYATNEGSYDDRGNALAVVAGLASPSEYAHIITLLENVKKASPYMEKYVLEALCLLGEPAAAKTRMKDRYGAMISDEGTTLWELWSKSSGTVNHGWTGGPLTVMSQYFEGLAPTKAGYAAYTLAPSSILTSLKANTSTIKGDIAFDLAQNGSVRTLKLTTINANGTLLIPTQWGTAITVSGGSYTANGKLGEATSFTLSGGSYTFSIA